MSRVIFSPKLASSTETYTFDFTSRLAPTETISTASCTVQVYSGVDGSPSSMLSGSAAISGAQVGQLLTSGVAGVIYEILCSAHTSVGQTLYLSAYLAVIPELS